MNKEQVKNLFPQKCVRGVCRLTLFAVASTKGGVRSE